jgi:prolyl-tRNA synthetase
VLVTFVQGVPVRVEVGPRDVASGSCVVSRRDRPGKDGKAFGVSAEPAAFVQHVSELLDDVQVN